ncbi:unnamed protein product [Closterium sp. NIES-53]
MVKRHNIQLIICTSHFLSCSSPPLSSRLPQPASRVLGGGDIKIVKRRDLAEAEGRVGEEKQFCALKHSEWLRCLREELMLLRIERQNSMLDYTPSHHPSPASPSLRLADFPSPSPPPLASHSFHAHTSSPSSNGATAWLGGGRPWEQQQQGMGGAGVMGARMREMGAADGIFPALPASASPWSPVVAAAGGGAGGAASCSPVQRSMSMAPTRALHQGIHSRWHTAGGTQQVAHRRWHTAGGTQLVAHSRWHTAGGAQQVAHRRWHTAGA